jgi:hypothetical protein
MKTKTAKPSKTHIDKASKKASALFRKARKNGRGRAWAVVKSCPVDQWYTKEGK